MTLAEQKTNSKAAPLHDLLIKRRQVSKEDDWQLAHILYSLRRYELWRFTTGGIESWEDYLKQPEINISRHKADKLIRIYEYFMVELGLEPTLLREVPWSALDLISKKRPEARDKVEELLFASLHLATKDFKETYFDVTDGGDRTYSYVLMKKCDQTGNLEKVHDIDSDTIKQALNL